jgi:DNA-binding IclR family transcriptional regulator
LILSSLRHGPAGRRELLAITGLPKAIAEPLIERLVEDGRLHRIERSDGVLFELTEKAIAAPRGG